MNRGKKNRTLITVLCLSVFFLGNRGVCAEGKNSSPSSAHRQGLPIEVAAAVDKSSILIGDKVTYAITVKAEKDIEVEFPQSLPENLAGFAVKDFGSKKTRWFNKKIYRYWYLLDTYVSGGHVIPASVIKYRKNGSSEWQELSAKEVKLEVKSVLEGAQDQKDIRDIRGPKAFAGKIWLYALNGIILLLIGAAVLGLIILRKKRKEEKAPPRPAHVIAYEALGLLEKKDYIRRRQIKAYYTELSLIARHYLENRFNIRAPEMTTEEFLIKVKEGGALSFEHKGLLREFLSCCDLVKFAKYEPVDEQAALSLASAKKLIGQTKEEERPL